MYVATLPCPNDILCQGCACADPESFVRVGPTLTTFFLFDKGRKDQNTTISGPPTAHQTAFRWRADDGPTLNAGLVAL